MKRFTPARFLASLAIVVGTASGALLQSAEAAHLALHAGCRHAAPPKCACPPRAAVRAVAPAATCPLCAVTARGCEAAPFEGAPAATVGDAFLFEVPAAESLLARVAVLLPPALGPPARAWL